MPPVGQNFASGNGAATDLSHAVPPEASAEENFRTFNPRAESAIAWETVAQPGSAGTEASASTAVSSGGVPGLTRYVAPAATANTMSDGRVMVPAPTAQSGAPGGDGLRGLVRGPGGGGASRAG